MLPKRFNKLEHINSPLPLLTFFLKVLQQAVWRENMRERLIQIVKVVRAKFEPQKARRESLMRISAARIIRIPAESQEDLADRVSPPQSLKEYIDSII